MRISAKKIEELLRKAPKIVGPKLNQEQHRMLMKKLDIGKQEDRKFHRQRGNPPRLTSEEHDQLMQRLGIGKDEDEKWHREHGVPQPHTSPTKSADRESVNPFAIGGGFLSYCVKQGWIIQEGSGRSSRYFVTTEGKRQLAVFGIDCPKNR